MEVHGRIHQAARREHPLQRGESLAVQRDLALEPTKGLQESREIDHPMGRARVMRVPHQIVDLIRVHRTVDDLRQVSRRFLSGTGHEEGGPSLRGASDQRGDGVGIHAVFLEDLVDPQHLGEGRPILGRDVVVVSRDDPLREVHVID